MEPSSFSLEGLVKQISDQKYPPVDKWQPDFCGNIDMRIEADGTWYYMGTPITRERMVRLFASVLRKDDDGETYLVTPVEKIGITVVDAPFVATSVEMLQQDGRQTLVFETNVGDKIMAGASNPIHVDINEETQEPRPYIKVRGNLEALIGRSVFYQMVEAANTIEKSGKQELLIESDGIEFSLGSWSEA
jgi:hypothetical protein